MWYFFANNKNKRGKAFEKGIIGAAKNGIGVVGMIPNADLYAIKGA